MKAEAIAATVVASVTVLSFLLKLHDRNPQVFVKYLKTAIEAFLEAIPFGFIPYHLPSAIILFTVTRVFCLYKAARNPNITVHDAFWAMAMLCIQSGIFAATVILVRF